MLDMGPPIAKWKGLGGKCCNRGKTGFNIKLCFTISNITQQPGSAVIPETIMPRQPDRVYGKSGKEFLFNISD